MYVRCVLSVRYGGTVARHGRLVVSCLLYRCAMGAVPRGVLKAYLHVSVRGREDVGEILIRIENYQQG